MEEQLYKSCAPKPIYFIEIAEHIPCNAANLLNQIEKYAWKVKVYRVLPDGKIIWTTPSIKQLLGYSADEARGKNILDLYVCPGDHDELKHKLDVNDGRLQHFETRLES